MKKIAVKQGIRDSDDNSLAARQRNPLSHALTRKFLHRNSELMRRLQARQCPLPDLRLTMQVQLEGRDLTHCYSRLLNRGFVKSIS